MPKYNTFRFEIIFVMLGVMLISSLFYLLNINEDFRNYPLYVSILMNILVTSFIWLGCRIIVNFLWIKYPWEKYPLKHLIIEVALILFWAFLVMFAASYLYFKLNNIKAVWQDKISSLILGLLITLFITSIHESAFFYQQWKNNFNLSLKLKKDHLEAKYETLKAQLNPHFLFNSLNTLITYVDDIPKASDYIQNLSDFLRFVLKNRDKHLITLNEELEACQMYLFLQKARFGDNLNWENNIDKETRKTFVAPLAIQMLLENAIKHNIISKEKPLQISIGSKKNEYIFVENNIQKKLSESSTGIGLKNIIERYEYLSSAKLQIIENSFIFKVMIPLIKKSYDKNPDN